MKSEYNFEEEPDLLEKAVCIIIGICLVPVIWGLIIVFLSFAE